MHTTGDALHADGVSHGWQTCGLGEGEVEGGVQQQHCLFSGPLAPTPAAAQDLPVPSSPFRVALRSPSSESRLDRPPSRIPASLWAPGWPVPSPPAAPHACFADTSTIRCPALDAVVWSQPLMQQRWFKSRLRHVPSAAALSPWFVLSFTICVLGITQDDHRIRGKYLNDQHDLGTVAGTCEISVERSCDEKKTETWVCADSSALPGALGSFCVVWIRGKQLGMRSRGPHRSGAWRPGGGRGAGPVLWEESLGVLRESEPDRSPRWVSLSTSSPSCGASPEDFVRNQSTCSNMMQVIREE